MTFAMVRLCGAALLLSGCLATFPALSQQTASVPLLLSQVKLAYGGSLWEGVETVTAFGTKDHFGLDGSFVAQEDLRTGHFAYRSRYEFLVNGEGLDASGRWRQDHSGAVHPLNSADAKAVTIAESYVSRRGYLFPSTVPAVFSLVSTSNDTESNLDHLTAEPQSGRPVQLWFDRKTHLLACASIELSVGTKTVRYGDYRKVQGLTLPFSVAVDNRDEAESGTATVKSYEINGEKAAGALTRPDDQPSDVQSSAPGAVASPDAYIDQQSGFLIVRASINGHGPYPFILDTGGHDILTPQVAEQLHLTPSGHGVSTGVGAGTTNTQYLLVDRLALGSATMLRQPFTVLHLDLGSTRAAGRKSEAVAGLLGLELFERFAVKIDFAAGSISLTPASGFHYEGRGKSVPITFTSDMPLVPGRLDGQDGSFGMDTGNNVGLIVFSAWLKARGLESSYQRGSEQHGMGVGGRTGAQPAVSQSFSLGGIELGKTPLFLSTDLSGALAARSEAGNFGNSILRHFAVLIDYKRGFMFIE